MARPLRAPWRVLFLNLRLLSQGSQGRFLNSSPAPLPGCKNIPREGFSQKGFETHTHRATLKFPINTKDKLKWQQTKLFQE